MKIKVARKPANTYQHGNLREALVQAGLKLLSEGGVEGLSLRAAALLAGVSHAAPYRHFKDKDALVAAIAERGFRLLTASMRAELDALPDRNGAGTRIQLRAIGKGYVRFALQHPAYLRVIFGGVLAQDRTTPELTAAGNEAYEMLRGCVAGGLARGDLQGGDADTVSLAAWSMVHGLSHLLINQAVKLPPGMAVEVVTDSLLGLLDAGLRPRK